MATFFSSRVKALKEPFMFTGPEGIEKKMYRLKQLASITLATDKTLVRYHDSLLFTCVFPGNKKILSLAEKELKRVTAFLKNKRPAPFFCNSGMPFTAYHSSFSHDFTRWILQHRQCGIKLSEFKNGKLELNEVLNLTLPSTERSETTAGLSNEMLLDTLLVPVKDRLQFLITELSKLDKQPYIKDHLFESLGIYCDIIPRSRQYSIAYNRIPVNEISFRQAPVRSFDHFELFRRPVENPVILNNPEKEQLISIIKNSMALTDRETDTVTFMEENSIRLYRLEHGISVAIYGAVPDRQLPLESYIGFTLFVNGFPVAYGGAWIFGEIANFGINIFDVYRGAESGYILCQLLRLYRQVFSVSYFEIEPYQFGLDNPEGILSGAFWFYFRYGFRSQDKKLHAISLQEKEKINANKKYRTAAKTLIRFTHSNMVLRLERKVPVRLADITGKIIKFISKKYQSDTIRAEADCVERFKTLTGIDAVTDGETQVLKEVSLWAAALGITDKKKLKLLGAMVSIKPADTYAYQELLLEFFNPK